MFALRVVGARQELRFLASADDEKSRLTLGARLHIVGFLIGFLFTGLFRGFADVAGIVAGGIAAAADEAFAFSVLFIDQRLAAVGAILPHFLRGGLFLFLDVFARGPSRAANELLAFAVLLVNQRLATFGA